MSVAAHAQKRTQKHSSKQGQKHVQKRVEKAVLPTGVVVSPAELAAARAAARADSIADATKVKVALSPDTPTANPNAIKVKAEANPATGKLTVKTDNAGPTRIELTDAGGRPVLTYTMMNGLTPAVLNVSQLPAGSYIVRCTAYEKTGMRQIKLGQ